MVKKIIVTISVVILLATFNISALSLNIDFFVYGEDTDRLCEILDMSESEIDDYCESNGITYLAVDKDNTRQIRKTETSDDFSKEIFDLSLLEDKKIFGLSAELSGFENPNGSILRKDDLKFYKTEHETKDSGGGYVITQYVTITNGVKKVLTFYTAKNTDRNYIDSAFAEQFKPKTDYTPFLTGGVALFAVVGVVVLVLIVKDFKKDKE